MKNLRLCKSCEELTLARNNTKGSFIIELALWCIFLVPGFIYSLWRLTSKHKVCAYCKSPDLISPNSICGIKLREANGKYYQERYYTLKAQQQSDNLVKGVFCAVGFVMSVAFVFAMAA